MNAAYSLLGAALLLLAATGEAEERKNVLFFAVDDLRPELTCYGDMPGAVTPKMHTPNFDALARRSLVLRKNYVQQAVCSPTRTSLLTSRRPDRTHVYDLTSYFRDVGGNFTTIPQYFKEKGYVSVGMGKIFHPGKASGEDDRCCSWSDGTEYYHAPNQAAWSGKDPSSLNSGKSWFAVPEDMQREHPLPDQQIAEHAVSTIANLSQTLPAGQNFFLAVGFHKPHLPFVFPERLLQHYPNVSLPLNPLPPQDMPAIAWSNYGELRAYADQAPLNASGHPGTDLPDKDVLDLRRAYYAAVTATDEYLGQVLAALEASRFANNTVISIWGDHGWQLGEHGEWCKHTNFELAVRAPMMVHVPGKTDSGVVSDMYTEHCDLFPTLVEAALGEALPSCAKGTASPGACTEGTSLVPLMAHPDHPVKQASFSQYPRGYVKPDDMLGSGVSPCLTGKCTMGYSLVTLVDGKEFRFTQWCDFNTVQHLAVDWSRCVGVELYDHSTDPAENINLAAHPEYKEVVASLTALLHTYA